MATTINDGILETLDSFEGSSADRQMAWLKSEISPTPADGLSLQDYWLLYMAQMGHTSGTTQERIARFMQTYLLPFTTQDPLFGYNDLQLAFWCNAGIAPDYETTFLNQDLGEWTVTRASGASTYFGDWPVEYVSTNEPVWAGDYALLSFPPASNFLGYTDDIGDATAGWGVYGGTLSVGHATALDGTTTANKLIASEVAEAHYMRIDPTDMQNGTTLFFAVRADGSQFTRISIATAGGTAVIDVANKTVVSETTPGTVEVFASGTNLFTPWLFINMYKPETLGNVYAFITLQDSDGNEAVAGDGTSGMLFWGGTFVNNPSFCGYIANSGAAPAAVAETTITLPTTATPEFTGDNYAFQLNFYPVLNQRALYEPAVGPQVIFTAQTDANNGIAVYFDPTVTPVLVYIRVVDGVVTGISVPVPTGGGSPMRIFFAHNSNVGITLTLDGVSASDTSANARAAWTAAVPSQYSLLNGSGILNYPAGGGVNSFRFWSPDLW